VKVRKVKRRGRRSLARRPTLPDICREIGREFFNAATSLELTGENIRKETKALKDLWQASLKLK
jgi:hypothetical protein